MLLYGVEFLDVDQRRILLVDRLPYGYCTGLVFSPTNARVLYSTVGRRRSYRRRSVRFHEFGNDFRRIVKRVFRLKGRSDSSCTFLDFQTPDIRLLVSGAPFPCCDFYIHEDQPKNKPPTLFANKIEDAFALSALGGSIDVWTRLAGSKL